MYVNHRFIGLVRLVAVATVSLAVISSVAALNVTKRVDFSKDASD